MAKPIITSKKQIASLGKRELRITTMNGEDKWDIRAWNGDKYDDGVRFTDEELTQLSGIVAVIKDTKLQSDMVLGTIGNKKCIIKNGEYCLSININGRDMIRAFATVDEMKALKVIIDKALAQKEKSLTEYLNTYTDEPEKSESKKSNIIMFKPPKAKEEITDKLVTEGNATYEQCVVKIAKEKEQFTDEDSQYVLDGILELCKVDAEFRNNVMREDKSYLGAMQYMMSMAQKGFAFQIDKGYAMSRDMGLGFALDYYNVKPEPPKKKAEPKSKAKTTSKKRGRPKKGA